MQYKAKLELSKIIKPGNPVEVEPDEGSIKSQTKILQQGSIRFKDSDLGYITEAITPNIQVFYDLYNKGISSRYVPFPLYQEFRSWIAWGNRANQICYHGRIIPEKLPFSQLKKLDDLLGEIKYKGVLLGPICKEYWTNKDLQGDVYDSYRADLKTLKHFKFIKSTDDREEIASILNESKFYFTFSTGECFNVALQEAVACGTIPIVINSEAYFWANAHICQIGPGDHFFSFLKTFSDFDPGSLQRYSRNLAKYAYTNFSPEVSFSRYQSSFWNPTSRNIQPWELLGFDYDSIGATFKSARAALHCKGLRNLDISGLNLNWDFNENGALCCDYQDEIKTPEHTKIFYTAYQNDLDLIREKLQIEYSDLYHKLSYFQWAHE